MAASAEWVGPNPVVVVLVVAAFVVVIAVVVIAVVVIVVVARPVVVNAVARVISVVRPLEFAMLAVAIEPGLVEVESVLQPALPVLVMPFSLQPLASPSILQA